MSRPYDSRAWRRRRLAQLRDEPLCRLCWTLHKRVVEATIADHVERHGGDPVLFEAPLQSLCAPCHSSLKQSYELTGKLKGHDRSGDPIDPNHPWNRRK